MGGDGAVGEGGEEERRPPFEATQDLFISTQHPCGSVRGGGAKWTGGRKAGRRVRPNT